MSQACSASTGSNRKGVTLTCKERILPVEVVLLRSSTQKSHEPRMHAVDLGAVGASTGLEVLGGGGGRSAILIRGRFCSST